MSNRNDDEDAFWGDGNGLPSNTTPSDFGSTSEYLDGNGGASYFGPSDSSSPGYDPYDDPAYDWVSGGAELSNGGISWSDGSTVGSGDPWTSPVDTVLDPVTVTGSMPQYLPDPPYQDFVSPPPLQPTGTTPGEDDQMLGFFPIPPYQDPGDTSPLDPTGLPDLPDLSTSITPLPTPTPTPTPSGPPSPGIPPQTMPRDPSNPGTGGGGPKDRPTNPGVSTSALIAPTFSNNATSLDQSVMDAMRRLQNGRSSTILTGGQGEDESKLQTSSILLGR